jgi:hypothetical protein
MIKTPSATPVLFTIALLLAATMSNAKTAEEVIIVDGREVLLKDDGTWKFLSTDRYANTKGGTRVRLKEDGSWQMIGNAPLQSKEQVRTTDLDIKLQKVVIETFEKKVQKNTRIKTQTVFYIDLAFSPQAKSTITVSKDDISLIEVKDNNGKNYPIVSIHPGDTQLQADTKTTLVIRAEKSPSIFDDVKSMDIIFHKGIFGIIEPITLSQRTIDFNKENVKGF